MQFISPDLWLERVRRLFSHIISQVAIVTPQACYGFINCSVPVKVEPTFDQPQLIKVQFTQYQQLKQDQNVYQYDSGAVLVTEPELGLGVFCVPKQEKQVEAFAKMLLRLIVEKAKRRTQMSLENTQEEKPTKKHQTHPNDEQAWQAPPVHETDKSPPRREHSNPSFNEPSKSANKSQKADSPTKDDLGKSQKMALDDSPKRDVSNILGQIEQVVEAVAEAVPEQPVAEVIEKEGAGDAAKDIMGALGDITQ